MKLLRKFLANIDDSFYYPLLHRLSEVFINLRKDKVELLIISCH